MLWKTCDQFIETHGLAGLVLLDEIRQHRFEGRGGIKIVLGVREVAGQTGFVGRLFHLVEYTQLAKPQRSNKFEK